jgi:hypothetical protein
VRSCLALAGFAWPCLALPRHRTALFTLLAVLVAAPNMAINLAGK